VRKRLVTSVLGAAFAVGVIAAPAMAAQPTNPGCFGTDRAAYIQNNALTDTTAPGASEVGQILAGRAGDNGTINRDYMQSCGGSPS
jgi:hypothetical protein